MLTQSRYVAKHNFLFSKDPWIMGFCCDLATFTVYYYIHKTWFICVVQGISNLCICVLGLHLTTFIIVGYVERNHSGFASRQSFKVQSAKFCVIVVCDALFFNVDFHHFCECHFNIR